MGAGTVSAQARLASPAGAPASCSARLNVKLSFKIPYRVHYGQDVAMVGSTDELGNWDPRAGIGMRWSEGDVWHIDFEVAAGPNVEMEYKYVVRNPDGNAAVWKPGDNCRFSLSGLAPVLFGAARRLLGGVAVRDAWDGAIRDVSVEVADPAARARAASEATREHSAALAAALDELAAQVVHAEGISNSNTDPTSLEVLRADRAVAAAARKAAAAATALEAAHAAAGHLPAPSSNGEA